MVFATAEPLGPLGIKPRDPVWRGGREFRRSRAVSLSLHVSALRVPRLGHLRADRPVAGLLRLYTRNAADDPFCADATVGQGGQMDSLGHLVDVLGVVATILGVSVTIGFGVSQFVDGVYAVSGMEWLMNGDAEAPKPSTVGLICSTAGHHGPVNHLCRLRRWPGHQIPVKPQSGSVGDLAADIRRLWLFLLCDDEIRRGSGRLHPALRSTVFRGLWSANS